MLTQSRLTKVLLLMRLAIGLQRLCHRDATTQINIKMDNNINETRLDFEKYSNRRIKTSD